MTDIYRPLVVAHESAATASEIIRNQLTLFRKSGTTARPWDFAELHNPWSRAAQNFDSWAILDICQNKDLIMRAKEIIGPDIILYDTRLIPEPCDLSYADWHCDAMCFPVTRRRGLTVILPLNIHNEGLLTFKATADEKPESIPLKTGTYILMDAHQKYKINAVDKDSVSDFLVIRYFPATSRYLRDPACAEHQLLMERWPLLNYANAPLWLVAGEDHGHNNFVTGLNVKAGRWTPNPD